MPRARADEPRWADLAFAAADALKRTAWRDGRLYATRRGERAELNAYLDDHAFLLAALLELMQTRFRREDFEWARALADALLERFEDRDRGGFWFTSHDHERLFHRTKPGHDNATPAGNGIAASALVAFGHLAADVRYVDAAQRVVALFATGLTESPAGHSSVLAALTALDAPPASVLLTGDADVCAAWQRTLEKAFRPGARVFNLGGVRDVPEALVKGAAPTAGAAAWVCVGTTCLPPMTTVEAIEDALASTPGASPR